VDEPSIPLIRALGSWLMLGFGACAVTVGVVAWPDEGSDWLEESLALPVDPADQPWTLPASVGDPSRAALVSAELQEGRIDIPLVPQPEILDPETAIDQAVAEESDAPVEVAPAPVEVPRGEIAEAKTQDWLVHRMVPTETVEQIAWRYSVRPEELRMWNGLQAETEKLRPGARVKLKPRRIPTPRERVDYVVRPGDTWWKIGTAFGVDARELRRANKAAPQRLVVGTRIELWVDPVVYLWVTAESDPHTAPGVRRGAVGIGPPQDGRLVNGEQLPSSQVYTLRLPPSSYGTSHAVSQVVLATASFARKSDYARPLVFGSMSGKHGGPLAGHRSHQSGRDLDIALPLAESVPDFYPITPERVDWRALWHLVVALAETEQVVVIFFDYALQEHLHAAAVKLGVDEPTRERILQYPRGSKASGGLVRHWDGHQAHIHVRFTCGAWETECVSSADALADGG
jgi:LysM repeat protein